MSSGFRERAAGLAAAFMIAAFLAAASVAVAAGVNGVVGVAGVAGVAGGAGADGTTAGLGAAATAEDAGTTGTATPPAGRVLRVAADPNNLPFSNSRGEGFENRIAELLARDLGARLQYVWHAQRRGFFRNTLKAGKADLVLGVPAGFEMARTTEPYYYSAYTFVTRADRDLPVRSFDDPSLRQLKIGVQMVGDDGTNTPPAHVLARRGIINNIAGFTLYDDYSKENPPARIIEAVAGGKVDVAVAWGPMAGYFAQRQPVPLRVTPVSPLLDESGLPMAYGIALGVRRGDEALFRDVERVLRVRKGEIDRILDEYHVPRVDPASVPRPPREEEDDDD